MSRTYFLTICVIIFQHTGRIFIRYYAFYMYIYIVILFLLLFYVVFESTLLSYANPCKNWTFIEKEILLTRRHVNESPHEEKKSAE